MVDMGHGPAYILKDFKGSLLSNGWLYFPQKKVKNSNYKRHYWCPIGDYKHE